MRPFRHIKYLLEGAAAISVYAFVCLLPFAFSSWLFGMLARIVGPRLGVTRVIKKNLALALPEMSEEKRHALIPRIWENIGRVAGELPHIQHLSSASFKRCIEVSGHADWTKVKSKNQTAIFFGLHLANWEIIPKALYEQGMPVHVVYRRANNPYFDWLVRYSRSKTALGLSPKGRSGAKNILRAIKNHESIAMLIDQKMNDGIPVKFFGHDAMTASAIAELALNYNLLLVPFQIIRKKGAKFKMIFHKPLTIASTGNRKKDIMNTMTQIHTLAENWIREHPDQWFWMHKRWPKELYKN